MLHNAHMCFLTPVFLIVVTVDVLITPTHCNVIVMTGRSTRKCIGLDCVDQLWGCGSCWTSSHRFAPLDLLLSLHVLDHDICISSLDSYRDVLLHLLFEISPRHKTGCCVQGIS